ncbi:MAG TPA: hypothetical protein VHY34_09290 [Caulobacteraceae bacterium]|nr:hypothetical protein [Caulobacteraceae bacterium]
MTVIDPTEPVKPAPVTSKSNVRLVTACDALAAPMTPSAIAIAAPLLLIDFTL